MVIANIEVYSALAKTLADKVGAIVISVGFSLAPEHKSPTAHNNAYVAYEWVIKNASSKESDPKKTYWLEKMLAETWQLLLPSKPAMQA